MVRTVQLGDHLYSFVQGADSEPHLKGIAPCPKLLSAEVTDVNEQSPSPMVQLQHLNPPAPSLASAAISLGAIPTVGMVPLPTEPARQLILKVADRKAGEKYRLHIEGELQTAYLAPGPDQALPGSGQVETLHLVLPCGAKPILAVERLSEGRSSGQVFVTE